MGRRLRHTTIGGALLAAAAAVATLVATTAPASASTLSGSNGPTSGYTVVSVSGGPEHRPAYAQLAGGLHHSVGIDRDGVAYAWGSNEYGGLGTGTTTSSLVPVAVKAPAGVTFRAAGVGLWHTVAIGSDDVVYAWGAGSDGALGNGGAAHSSVPVPVSLPAGVVPVQLAVADRHSLVLGSDGVLYAWGDNSRGQLGDGTATTRLLPVPVTAPGGADFALVRTSADTTIALTTDGRLYAWGGNAYGQFGNGSTIASPSPVPATLPPGVVFRDADVDGGHVLALGSDGEAYSWGLNSDGQLGDGTLAGRSVPGPLTAPAGVSFTALSAGSAYSLALDASGTVYGWGSNYLGGIGPDAEDPSLLPTPIAMPGGAAIASIVAGNHSLAIGTDGTAFGWGRNDWGQLGNGSSGSLFEPAAPGPVSPPQADIVSVLFAGLPGTVIARPPGSVLVLTPPHPAAVVDVTIVRSDGHREVLPAAFTFGSAPVILESPASATLPEGGSVDLTAAAQGDEAPTVRWERSAGSAGPDDWQAVAGADEDTLTVTGPGRYRAVYENGLGTATTEPATVSPATTPPTPTPPAPTPSPTPTTPATPGAPGAHTPGSSDLARTGLDTAVPLVAAGLLLAAGAVVLIVRARRSRRS